VRIPPLARTLAVVGLLILVGAEVNLAASVPPVGLPAVRVLQMALEAPRLIDYEGTKVITALKAGRAETVTVSEWHKRPDMMRLEYLSPEDVAGRLIVDNGTNAWHYEPRLNMAFEGPTFEGDLLSRDLTLLHRNYRLTSLGVDEVIGRQAYVVVLDPVMPGVRRQFWVDRATGTILRSEERDPDRGVILSTYFSRVSFSLNLPDAYFRFRMPGGARVYRMPSAEAGSMSPAALEQQVRFPVLIPPVLPEGYTFHGGALSRFGSLTSVYLRYSDGENLISLFEAPAGSIGWPSAGQPVPGWTQPARLVDLGYFRVLIWEQRGLRLTAVGTVPTETLLVVARQLAAGHEQALVTDVSRRVESDPTVVRTLRGEGLTFPEVARALVLSQRLGADPRTTARFVRGTLTISELAGQLRMRPEVLKQAVQDALREAPTVPPALAGR